MSTFSGLSVALSSLQSQRRVMDVIAQNLTNVNTPGYTRQRAELQEIAPGTVSNLWGNVPITGDGVHVATVTRITDEVIQSRLRGHEADAGYLASSAATMAGVEKDFGEPSQTGLTEQLATWFSTWGDVSNSPDDHAAIGVMLQQSGAVADTIRDGYENVAERAAALRERVDVTAAEINAATESIAALNTEIFRATVAGAPANELKDQRDILITKLSGLAGVQVSVADAPAQNEAMVKISLAGVTLVNGQQVTGKLTGTGGSALGDVVGLALQPTGGGAPIVVSDGSITGGRGVVNGRLGADLDMLNATLPETAAGFDAVAAKLTALMSANGNPGLFTGTAATLRVGISDPAAVVTSNAGTRDGAVADAIVAARTDADGPAAAWTRMVGSAGTTSRSLATRSSAAENNRLAAETALSSATGVDIDEEMTRLVATQRAYEAAGKLLATIDSMLDTLINRTGR